MRTASDQLNRRSRLLVSIAAFGLLLAAGPSAAAVKVFACEPEWKALAEALGGEHLSIYSATTAFQDPHHIEARPSLIARARQAELLICTGAELEIGWLPLLLRQSGNARIQQDRPGYFLAASQVDRIEVPTQVDRSHGDVHASGNPHVHWDPHRLLTIAGALSARLQRIDAANAADYRARYQAFARQWRERTLAWEAKTASLRGKKVFVYHKNWSYLLNWLGMETVGDLEPKPGIPPTSAQLAKLLATARSRHVDFILIANYQNEKGARWLGDKTGIPLIQLPFTVGGTEAASDLPSLYDDVLSSLIADR